MLCRRLGAGNPGGSRGTGMLYICIFFNMVVVCYGLV